MTISPDSILFNKTASECRAIGRRGGLAHARNLRRARKAAPIAPAPEEIQHEQETMAEATARIDRLCPWLRGVEIRTRKRVAA